MVDLLDKLLKTIYNIERNRGLINELGVERTVVVIEADGETEAGSVGEKYDSNVHYLSCSLAFSQKQLLRKLYVTSGRG